MRLLFSVVVWSSWIKLHPRWTVSLTFSPFFLNFGKRIFGGGIFHDFDEMAVALADDFVIFLKVRERVKRNLMHWMQAWLIFFLFTTGLNQLCIIHRRTFLISIIQLWLRHNTLGFQGLIAQVYSILWQLMIWSLLLLVFILFDFAEDFSNNFHF